MAYLGSRKKSALGLLFGHVSLALGLFLMRGRKAVQFDGLDSIGFLMTILGLVLVALSFVIYVKQVNSMLKFASVEKA